MKIQIIGWSIISLAVGVYVGSLFKQPTYFVNYQSNAGQIQECMDKKGQYQVNNWTESCLIIEKVFEYNLNRDILSK